MIGFPPLKIGNLDCPTPIVQGGMGVGISMAGLASAVANEGGVGVIAAAMIGIDEPDVSTHPAEANARALRHEIRRARALTNGVLGVNIMVALTHFSDLVQAAVAEGIDLIFAGAGLPTDLPAYLPAGARTKLVPIVSSARAAGLLCKKWLTKYDYLPDAIVVEGPEAGGHLGFRREQLEEPGHSLHRLIPEVVAAVRPYAAAHAAAVPIIAAGGVYTGRDIREMLELGAAGVQMGTRFVATHECDAAPAFKQAFLDARREDLVIITSPVGMPGRAVRNRFLDEVDRGEKKPFRCPYHCVKTCRPAESPYCIALALAAARRGRFKNGFAFAGSNAYRVNRLLSVKELIDSLRSEYSDAVNLTRYDHSAAIDSRRTSAVETIVSA